MKPRAITGVIIGIFTILMLAGYFLFTLPGLWESSPFAWLVRWIISWFK